jgi:hypothetical protein
LNSLIINDDRGYSIGFTTDKKSYDKYYPTTLRRYISAIILFLPLNYGIMQPTLHNMVNTLNSKSSENLMAKQLLELSNVIIFGSLVIHGKIHTGGRSWAFVQD